MSVESGNVWSRRSQMSLNSLRTDLSLFFAADTYLGPAYLAGGYDQSGSTALYLYLGHSF
jgi:NTE family protein